MIRSIVDAPGLDRDLGEVAAWALVCKQSTVERAYVGPFQSSEHFTMALWLDSALCDSTPLAY